MKPEITQIWSDWRRGDFTPENKRQEKLLEAWSAFLEEQLNDFGLEVVTIPELFNDLWEAAEITENTKAETSDQ